jgi:hypothetical protein
MLNEMAIAETRAPCENLRVLEALQFNGDSPLYLSSWARIYRRNVRRDVRLLHNSCEVQGKLCSAVLGHSKYFFLPVPARKNLSVREFHEMGRPGKQSRGVLELKRETLFVRDHDRGRSP